MTMKERARGARASPGGANIQFTQAWADMKRGKLCASLCGSCRALSIPLAAKPLRIAGYLYDRHKDRYKNETKNRGGRILQYINHSKRNTCKCRTPDCASNGGE